MKSINSRIIILFGLLLSIVCMGLGVVSYIASSNSLVNVYKDTMPKFAIEASLTIEESIQNQLNTLSLIASLNDLQGKEDISNIVPLLSRETKRAGHRKMIFIDKSGQAVSNSGEFINMNDNALFKSAVSGENALSDPLFDSDGSIVMVYAVPVKDDNGITGVLMAYRDGLELSEFAQRIQFGKTGEAFIINEQGRTIAHADTELLQEIITSRTADTETSASLAINSEEVDTVTSATLDETQNNSNMFGFDNFTKVQIQMMDGETGFEEYKYNNISKVVGFAPVPDYGWSIAVSVDKDEVMSELSSLKAAFILISIAFIIIGFLVAYLIGRNVSKPIVELTDQCSTMSDGDFTNVTSDKYLNRRDEIGKLATGFNKINTNVSGIIKNVISEANSMSNAIVMASNSMSELAKEIDVMTDITVQLSSKIQQTSAMAQEMNATSAEIESAIDTIANNAQEGAESATDVSRRADELKKTAEESQKSAQNIRLNVAVKLREAIDQSKAVEKISILSEAILGISSQTNLLALNAAIEASQAGEAGRGFAVVASEIRKLAEQSKQTVTEIQDVTQQVLESVQNLSVSSEQVLAFLDNKVAKDYDMLKETGEKYSNDAKMIGDIVTDFSATSEQLYSSVENMMQAINDVANAATEGASDTADMAREADAVEKRSNEVIEQAKTVRDSAEKLLNLVTVFKV